ncbi:unnamed protein product [Rotaria socialis]|uniref:Uncharacterized protein n=1 Tax=Rotaria socialis TaxID=392032 RepID=A0A817RD10_9BILA|nr:unnamed protein product [Rotaria socialis]
MQLKLVKGWQEKVPESIAAGKKFAIKAVKIGHKYGEEALEQTEKYAGHVYEAAKEKQENSLRMLIRS